MFNHCRNVSYSILFRPGRGRENTHLSPLAGRSLLQTTRGICCRSHSHVEQPYDSWHGCAVGTPKPAPPAASVKSRPAFTSIGKIPLLLCQQPLAKSSFASASPSRGCTKTLGRAEETLQKGVLPRCRGMSGAPSAPPCSPKLVMPSTATKPRAALILQHFGGLLIVMNIEQLCMRTLLRVLARLHTTSY